ncbi:hypothetical protein ABFA07_007595 [Porites harrisoni]
MDIAMEETTMGEENPYIEIIESKQTDDDAETYDDVAPDKGRTPSTELAQSCQENFPKLQRMLSIVTAVAIISLLTAAASLALLNSQNTTNSLRCSADCVSNAAVQGTQAQLQGIQKNISHMVASEVSIRIAEPGPAGERGQNGFRGPTGETGPPGPKGPMGIQGITGAQGDKGMKGYPGFPGKNGSKGATGDKGIKGQQGDTGPPGIQGDTGDPGSRGIGNFSWCQPSIKEGQTQSVYVADTQNTKVIGAYCTTTTADAESNLAVLIQSPHNTYSCVCRGSGGNPHCALHYWECPIHAP